VTKGEEKMSDATALATVDVKSLSKPDLAKAQEYAKAIDPGNNGSLTQFGVAAQSKIGGLADTMLTQIRTKDAGEVGEALSNLVFSIKGVDVNGFTKGHGGLLSNLKNKAEHFMAKYEKMETQIDKIVDQLEKAKRQMLTDINMMDQLYKQNDEYMHNLDLYIAAGQMRVEELKAKMLPDLEAKAKSSGDPKDAQNLSDFNQFLERVDKKLHDLKLSRMISIQTAPQVRLIQGNDNVLVEKIQSSIMTTIPLWKQQIAIAVALFHQKGATEVEKKITDETNELLTKNAELLHTGSVAVAKEAERGIVEIETLQKTNDELIATIEETLQIQKEGRDKRVAAAQTLKQLEADLGAKLSQPRN
jgi:uncharacterized protein YaaN involved in tellurite resistance